MPKIIKSYVFVLVLSCIAFIIFTLCSVGKDLEPISVVRAEVSKPTYKSVRIIEKEVPDTTAEQIEEPEPIEDELYSTEEIELMALVTMAEAEGECEEGKRLVIDTILNRVDSKYFPDTVHDVIYQPYQFSCMWNGRVEKCEVREDIYELVKVEILSRTNYECVFFSAGNYSKYGIPLFQVENHYFSKYE